MMKSMNVSVDIFSELSKRLRVAGEMGKVTGDNFHFPYACKIELCAFREAGTFIRVDGEMRWLPAYFLILFY